jgi:flagellum-specific ATP synthase
MGGYHPGTDADLDHAVTTVPRIYAALRQDPSNPQCADAFAELAQVLRG